MSAHLAAVMWFQGADYASSDSFKLLTWAVCIIALGSLVQLAVFLGAAVAGWRAYKSATKALAEVKGKAYPLIGSVQGVVDDVRPKVVSITESVRGIMEDARPKVASVTENVRSIVDDAAPKIKAITDDAKTVSSNFVDTSVTLREKAKEIADNVTQTVDDANQKTRAQIGKVDHMVSSAFQATGDVAAKIHHGIKVPVNEVVGWVNAAKASLDKFMSHEKAAGKDAAAKTSKPTGGSTDGPLSGLLGMFRKVKQPPAKWHQPGSASETLTKSGFPESGRAAAAERSQVLAAQAAEHDVLNDPSSAVVASPGAQEVVDRFLAEHKDDMPKPV